MKNSEKITARQLGRMLIAEGFGASAITFPAVAVGAFGQTGQSSGTHGIILYGAILIVVMLYFILCIELLGKARRQFHYEAQMGVLTGTIYMLRFFLNGMGLLLFFVWSIHDIYMPDTPLWFILIPLACLVGYCSCTNLQKRGRFIELIFPWIFATFVLVILLCVLGLFQKGSGAMLPAEDISIKTACTRGYLLFLLSSPMEFIFFLYPATEEASLRRKKVGCSILTVILWNALLWFFTVNRIGVTLTGNSPWPVIKMIQLLRLPGNFMERSDILLIIFWVLCMIGVLSGYFYYARRIGEHFLKERKNMMGWVIGIVLCLALIASILWSGKEIFELFFAYKIWVDGPLILGLPLCILIKQGISQKKERKIK